MGSPKGAYYGRFQQWTPAENAIVRDLYARTPRRALRVTLTGALPGRTWSAIVAHADILDVPRLGCAWTAAEDTALRHHWGSETPGEILTQVPTMRWCGAQASGIARRGDGRTRGGRICRWLLVDLVLATIAVEEALARDGETVRGGAITRGVHPGALRRHLLKTGGFPLGRRGVRVLLPAAVLDAAASALRAAA